MYSYLSEVEASWSNQLTPISKVVSVSAHVCYVRGSKRGRRSCAGNREKYFPTLVHRTVRCVGAPALARFRFFISDVAFIVFLPLCAQPLRIPHAVDILYGFVAILCYFFLWPPLISEWIGSDPFIIGPVSIWMVLLLSLHRVFSFGSCRRELFLCFARCVATCIAFAIGFVLLAMHVCLIVLHNVLPYLIIILLRRSSSWAVIFIGLMIVTYIVARCSGFFNWALVSDTWKQLVSGDNLSNPSYLLHVDWW